MSPSSRGSSMCRLSLSCLAYWLAGGVVLLPNPMPSSRPTDACAWRRPSHVPPLLSGAHGSRSSSSATLLTHRVMLLTSFDDLIRARQQRRRDREAESLGGFEVDDQLGECRADTSFHPAGTRRRAAQRERPPPRSATSGGGPCRDGVTGGESGQVALRDRSGTNHPPCTATTSRTCQTWCTSCRQAHCC
jgi:hypothetical protein